MLDDKIANELLAKLDKLRDERIDRLAEERADISNLIADMINGLETLFIIINAPAAQESRPQATGSTFVSVSKPDQKKVI